MLTGMLDDCCDSGAEGTSACVHHACIMDDAGHATRFCPSFRWAARERGRLRRPRCVRPRFVCPVLWLHGLPGRPCDEKEVLRLLGNVMFSHLPAGAYGDVHFPPLKAP